MRHGQPVICRDGNHLDEAAAKARYQPRMIETVPICRHGLAPDELSRLPMRFRNDNPV
jgi:hypothetical protein